MEAIIYKIINDINYKVYVGQTCKTTEQRFARHCAEAKWKNTKKMPIILAIKKYGKEHFQIIAIEILTDCEQPQVNEREVFWAKELNAFSPNGYNLKAGQGNGAWSEEIKKKISLGNKGKKRTQETIEKLRVSHLGYKVKDSTKQKLSDFNRGKKLSAEHKKKIADSNTGRETTELAKEKMRIKKIKFNYRITSPDGILYETNNLRQFCRDKGLNAGHMSSVATNNKLHYKQWKVTKLNRSP